MQGLVEARIGNAILRLGALNLGVQINYSNNKRQRKKKKSQIVPSSSLLYCNNYVVINIVIKTNNQVNVELTPERKQSIRCPRQFRQKQPFADAFLNRCSQNFCNIHKKTPSQRPQTWNFTKKETATQVLSCEH